MFPVYIRNDDFGREEPPEDEDDWTLVDLQNKPSWSRIEANCPGITALVASETSWDPYVDAERLGRVLAANTRVKRFALVQHRVTQKAPFLRGLAPNRSIEHLGLQGCAFAGEDTAWLQYLRAFLEGNGSLHSLDWRGDWRDCREGGGGDWSALVNTLSKLNESVATCMLRDIRICDETAGDIVNALAANRNLSTLTFVKSNLGAGACTALGNWLQSPGCQLKHLDVQGNAINDKGVGVLVDALARNDTLRVLSLANNEQISPRGWRLFASSYAKSSGWAVQSLCLRGNKIGDGEIYSLGGAFAMSPFLRELDVSCNVEITEDGWVAFLACLAGDATTNMTSIELSGNRINDRAMTALGNVLTGRSSLVTLGLGCIGNVSLDGWREFSVALRSPTSKLEKIALENGITTDASLAALANGLANNSTVRSIDLSLKCTSPFAESMEAMDSVSSAGWQAFFTSLRNSKSVLEKLHLRSRPTFDDQAMAALVGTFGSHLSLSTLDVYGCLNISASGWHAFAPLLRTCKLVQLKIPPCADASDPTPWGAERDPTRPINWGASATSNDVLVAVATALVGNDSLRKLAFCTFDEVPARVWEAFSMLLCNPSSIGATYSSNHTLRTIRTSGGLGGLQCYGCGLPSDILSLLEWNQRAKFEASRLKILRCHLLKDGVDASPFDDIESSAVPHAISWIGRDSEGFPLLYALLQRMPTLFERKKNGGNPQTVLVDQCPYANVVPDAVEKVKEFYANHSEIKASHGWKEHVSVVFDHAEKALLSLECSLPPKEEMEVKLAALLHDVDDRKFFPDACPVTYPNARAILELVGISSGEEGDTSNNSHERIIQMISWVGCSENGNSVPEEVKKNETYHLLIPRWADRLEAVGAKGVVRCYQYNQERGRPLCSDKSPRPTSEEELWSYAPPERLQEYMDRGGTSTDMISHYYDKLLHIARPPKDIVRNPYLEKMAVSSSKDLVDVCLRFGRLGAVDEDHIMALMNETR
ncbi:hypothetical protein ACHAXT_003433 [Thalassiosira profunda]